MEIQIEYPNLGSAIIQIEKSMSDWERVHPHERLYAIIAGPTASGKNTLAEDMASSEETTILDLDRYYLSKDQIQAKFGKINFSTPEALDTERIVADINKICGSSPERTLSISVPVFDMPSSQRTGEEQVWLKTRIIIVGVYALDLVDIDTPFKIYVEASESTLLKRKMKRDVEQRGKSPKLVEQLFIENSVPAIRDKVSPQRAHARIVVHNE